MPVFHNHETAYAHFANVRDPAKGKPVRSFGRLYLANDNVFTFAIHGTAVFRLSPDNVLTFVMTPTEARWNSNTLSMALDDVVPLYWQRVGVGRYKVVSHWGSSQKPEYFQGMQFSMLTGTCLNPMPDLKDRVIPEARKVWLSALRKWKRGVKVRGKMGAIDAVIKTRRADTNKWRHVTFDNPQELDILYRCIKNNEHPTDMLRTLVEATSGYMGYYRSAELTTADVLGYVDTMLAAQSVELRKRFGVFGEDNSQ